MTSTADICTQLHPRVSVVPADASLRDIVRSALEEVAEIVDGPRLDERIAGVVRSRSAAEASRIRDLEAELAAVRARHDDLTAAHAVSIADHGRLLDAADWAMRQPQEMTELRRSESEALAVVEERARATRAASRDLDRVLEQRAAAEAALEDARDQLAARTASGARTETVDELERQVQAVEQRLREAEAAAREVSEEATRQLSRAELHLERIRHDARARRSRLEELLAALSDDAVGPFDDDVFAHAEQIGSATRDLAAQRHPGAERERAELDALTADVDRREDDLRRRRTRLGVPVPDDDAEALELLLATPGTAVLVLDDVLGADADPHQVRRRAVESAEGPPVVVLSDAADVLAWAIDLPADRGLVVSATALLCATDRYDLLTDEALAPAMETTP